MPEGIGIVDLMVGLPKGPDDTAWRAALTPLLRDAETLTTYRGPAEHLFKDRPSARLGDDPLAAVIAEMDRWGVARAMVGVGLAPGDPGAAAVRDHPDRFFGAFDVDPNGGASALRALRRAVAELGAKAATVFPAGTFPQVAVDDAAMYLVYATCVDLGIPVCVNAGVPGPRLPAATQDVMRFDAVCYDFPDLRIVMRHGAEPWAALAVKLMLKWPNLSYSTSAFAPRYYPADVVQFANTRGTDQVMYAGYFPMGLSLERIMTELPSVPFRDHVWPRFLRDNAVRVFDLDSQPLGRS
ncbi:MAG: putative TIM-barrel fold metal-dependent hydrolase [Acidimicrobiales bacterium]|jgi:predicted TIM-barrel fold metal-dependent hydrolase|nr:putative TIM-barrel fold metal-dependent hydrolase [Acidimicrobiales bacterium]